MSNCKSDKFKISAAHHAPVPEASMTVILRESDCLSVECTLIADNTTGIVDTSLKVPLIDMRARRVSIGNLVASVASSRSLSLAVTGRRHPVQTGYS